MSEVILSDYFYGDESEQFIYFRIPRLLITSPRFKHLSTDAKLLYGMLLDRMSLSAKNNWYDEDGRVYIYYTVEEICGDMNCGRDKAMKLLAELDTGKGVGLIERIKQGQGKPTKIYVKRFTTRAVPPPASPEPDSFMPIPEVDFSDVQKSEKPTSRGRQSRLAEVEKSDPNHTNRSHPDFSHPDPSISPRYPPYGEMDGIDRNQIREELKENIDYEHLCSQCPYDDVESLLELMVDVVSSTASTIRIGGEVLPLGPVKERFRQLDSSHIEYVIDSLKQTTTKINNIRAYLLTVLYNAPVTIFHQIWPQCQAYCHLSTRRPEIFPAVRHGRTISRGSYPGTTGSHSPRRPRESSCANHRATETLYHPPGLPYSNAPKKSAGVPGLVCFLSLSFEHTTTQEETNPLFHTGGGFQTTALS